MVSGSDYKLSQMDKVSFVDAMYPHAMVDSLGHWSADSIGNYGPIIQRGAPPEITVAFSSDRRYYPGLVVALSSFRRFHPDVHVTILDCGLSSRQVRFLQQQAEVIPSKNCLPDDPVWARFEVSLLPYPRVVYLDCDIVVLKPLTGLLNTDAEFAAARNLDWKVTANFRDYRVVNHYGIERERDAFCAGVFSLDNRKWGDGRLLREAMKVHDKNGDTFLYADQSALQIIMHSRNCVTFLDDSYSAFAEFWDWRTNANDARLIHYAGDEIKPWNPLCRQPMLEHFFSYSKIVRDV